MTSMVDVENKDTSMVVLKRSHVTTIEEMQEGTSGVGSDDDHYNQRESSPLPPVEEKSV